MQLLAYEYNYLVGGLVEIALEEIIIVPPLYLLEKC